jgi:hypothetical protein
VPVAESVTCGEELRVRYMLDYRYRTHSTGDYMGIFPHDQVRCLLVPLRQYQLVYAVYYLIRV